ncbi:MAG TPA: hypothetical protein VFQ39_02015, partial [Longimicrobium sp.]|nr:hypothetical protein [Longimicrobium sp.]
MSEASHGSALDRYGSSWRTTLLEVAGAGTYSEWTGGQPDWRARASGGGNSSFANPVTTNLPAKKVSYLIEPMTSRGIYGKIGAVMVGVRVGGVTTGTKAFVRRNGAETELTDLPLVNGFFRWYRVANAGWLPTDHVEVGVTTGAGAGTSVLYSVAVVVEHDTPEPAPITDTTVRTVNVTYTGNGTAQTVDLGGGGLRPTALMIAKVSTGGTAVPAWWWWESRAGGAGFNQSIGSYGRVWPQRGKFHVIHATDSYNEAGVTYTAVAIFDPSGRLVNPFAVSKPTGEDNYTHQLRHPVTGALLPSFTPNFVFGGAAFNATSDPVRGSLYKGPGHLADSTVLLGSPQAAAPDWIQGMGAGAVQLGTQIAGSGDIAFWAGRVSDGVDPTRLMAVGTYVGSGTATRTIPLALSGQTPTLVLVAPATTATRVYRADGDTTGRNVV